VALSVPANVPAPNQAGLLLGRLARSREATLAGVVIVLGMLVWLEAPNFLSSTNVISVTALAAIIAIAAVGEALVIITKNIDLSVESTMGLVAFVVAMMLKGQKPAGSGGLGAWDRAWSRPGHGQRCRDNYLASAIDRRHVRNAEHLSRSGLHRGEWQGDHHLGPPQRVYESRERDLLRRPPLRGCWPSPSSSLRALFFGTLSSAARPTPSAATPRPRQPSACAPNRPSFSCSPCPGCSPVSRASCGGSNSGSSTRRRQAASRWR